MRTCCPSQRPATPSAWPCAHVGLGPASRTLCATLLSVLAASGGGTRRNTASPPPPTPTSASFVAAARRGRSAFSYLPPSCIGEVSSPPFQARPPLLNPQNPLPRPNQRVDSTLAAPMAPRLLAQLLRELRELRCDLVGAPNKCTRPGAPLSACRGIQVAVLRARERRASPRPCSCGVRC